MNELNSKLLRIGREKVLEARYDSKGRLIVPADFYVEEIYSEFCESRLSDGLPIIPPTKDRVKRMLEYTDWDPNETLMTLPPKLAPLTIEKLAINAIMAGCKPQYLPVLITAFLCMKEEKYNLAGVEATTFPTVNLILVSGPIANQIGMYSNRGCVGPGFRANATIGRAVNLTLINVGGSVPGLGKYSCLGSPARYSFCFSENREEYPSDWKPIHEELYGKETTTVTCFAGEAPHNIISPPGDAPERVLMKLSSAITHLGANIIWARGELVVILNPFHAKRLFDELNWSKDDVKRFIFDHAHIATELYEASGPLPHPTRRPTVPVILTPKHIIVAVAGGGGDHTFAVLPFGSSFSLSVTKPITSKNGKHAKSLEDLRRK